VTGLVTFFDMPTLIHDHHTSLIEWPFIHREEELEDVIA